MDFNLTVAEITYTPVVDPLSVLVTLLLLTNNFIFNFSFSLLPNLNLYNTPIFFP